MKPIITPLPTANQIKQIVDEIITPELADAESRRLVQLVLAIAPSESDEQYDLAMTAARHAFTKTSAFEKAFREFAGFPVNRNPVISKGEKVEFLDPGNEILTNVFKRIENGKKVYGKKRVGEEFLEIDGEQ